MYSILAFYCLVPLDNPHEEMRRQRAFLETKDATGRIYFAYDGMNAQVCLLDSDARTYIDWIQQDVRFSDVDIKIHSYHEHVFPRLTIKVRSQLVALDVKVDFTRRGEYVSSHVWKEMLETKEEASIFLDVRNRYEWDIGHFEGAELLPFETFRQFPAFIEELKKRFDPQQSKVMMCCTGGIRCEFYSALLKQEGYDKVYQLQGGILRYGQEQGNAHWKGKLFVFDDRLAVPLTEDNAENTVAENTVIGRCYHCKSPSDVYYNCSNMDCNTLFICCSHCASLWLGCCSDVCLHQPRLRPYQIQKTPKPFRRLHLIGK